MQILKENNLSNKLKEKKTPEENVFKSEKSTELVITQLTVNKKAIVRRGSFQNNISFENKSAHKHFRSNSEQGRIIKIDPNFRVCTDNSEPSSPDIDVNRDTPSFSGNTKAIRLDFPSEKVEIKPNNFIKDGHLAGKIFVMGLLKESKLKKIQMIIIF